MALQFQELKDRFGYYFQPASYPHSPGHPALDVLIRTQPTQQFYDPESFTLRVQEADPHWQYRISQLFLFHPWTGKTEHVVAPGQMVIHDRRGKKIESFTFGGRLKVSRQENITHCRVESPAPILEMIEWESMSALLANQVKVILAELRGRSIGHLQIYESRLASVDPWELYRSSLVGVLTRLAEIDPQENDLCASLKDFVSAEIEALKRLGKWVREPYKIDDLLLPPQRLRGAAESD